MYLLPYALPARRGFTFIETLVALVVFSVLTAIAVPRYRDYKQRAYLATMRSDLGNLRISEEVYWADHLRYATDTTALEFRPTSDVRIAITSADVGGGYTATATHARLPALQCSTATGKEAINATSGSISCGPIPTGSGTLPTNAP